LWYVRLHPSLDVNHVCLLYDPTWYFPGLVKTERRQILWFHRTVGLVKLLRSIEAVIEGQLWAYSVEKLEKSDLEDFHQKHVLANTQ